MLNNCTNTSKKETNLLPGEQKECRTGSRDTKDQLLIDKMIVKDCKKWLTPLAVAWIDYRKADDMVRHSWKQKCMEVLAVAVYMRSFVNTLMKQWNAELTSGNQT